MRVIIIRNKHYISNTLLSNFPYQSVITPIYFEWQLTLFGLPLFTHLQEESIEKRSEVS